MEWTAFWCMCAVIALITSWKQVEIAKHRCQALQTLATMMPEKIDKEQIQSLTEELSDAQ